MSDADGMDLTILSVARGALGASHPSVCFQGACLPRPVVQVVHKNDY
jgi:hypothetical protein